MFPRRIVLSLGSIAAVAAVAALAACGGNAADPFSTIDWGDGGGGGQSASPPSCNPCMTDRDCNGGVCGQIAGDSYCAAVCGSSSDCPPDQACTSIVTYNGQSLTACVPRGDVCGGGTTSGGTTSGGGTASSSGGTSSGGGTTSSGGTSGSSSGGRGGSSSGSGSGGSSGSGSSGGGGTGSSSGSSGSSSGGAPSGSVGNDGGTVSSLLFAVVGDTRPPNTDDTSGYPTPIITQIYQDLQSMSPRPQFAVGTGDYMFATPGNGQASPQLNMYLGARKNFSNPFFPTMGNHECTGYTASNCGSGNSDGVTENYTAFMSQMLQPIGQTSHPYYSIDLNGPNNSWTAKLVFVAANAWDSTQSSWLDSTLSQSTTYTFIIRHEPASASTAPGVSPSEQIMANHPYTLAFVGHTHTVEKPGGQEALFGNGGAPLSSGSYGFGLVTQRSDGTIQVDSYDYQTVQPDTSFRFAVKPDGSAAQ